MIFCGWCETEVLNEKSLFCTPSHRTMFYRKHPNKEDRPSPVISQCLHCGIDIEYPKRKFCSHSHKNIYNHRVLYGYKYHAAYRSRSPKNFISGLLDQKGRKQTLSTEYVIGLYEDQDGKCAISGIEMTYLNGEGKVLTNISLDRISSQEGYVEGNIQLVCRQVNTMKWELGVDELRNWCRVILEGE